MKGRAGDVRIVVFGAVLFGELEMDQVVLELSAITVAFSMSATVNCPYGPRIYIRRTSEPMIIDDADEEQSQCQEHLFPSPPSTSFIISSITILSLYSYLTDLCFHACCIFGVDGGALNRIGYQEEYSTKDMFSQGKTAKTKFLFFVS